MFQEVKRYLILGFSMLIGRPELAMDWALAQYNKNSKKPADKPVEPPRRPQSVDRSGRLKLVHDVSAPQVDHGLSIEKCLTRLLLGPQGASQEIQSQFAKHLPALVRIYDDERRLTAENRLQELLELTFAMGCAIEGVYGEREVRAAWHSMALSAQAEAIADVVRLDEAIVDELSSHGWSYETEIC